MRWIRSVFRGNLGGGVEQFAWKLDWGIPGNDPQLAEEDAPDFSADLAGWLTAHWDTNVAAAANLKMKDMHSTDLSYTEIGTAQFTQSTAKNKDGTGGDVTQSYPMGWHGMPVGTRPTGNNTTQKSLPFEVSLAVTLQTDTRGPRGRGRVYLPALTCDAMAAGGVYVSQVPILCGSFIDMIADSVKSDRGWDLIVVSNRAVQLHKVTSIEAGKVPDSQRRRRRSQDEARVVVATR